MNDAVDAAVRAILPYDGPHAPESISAAIGVMAGLARHLANATRRPAAIPLPTDLDTAVQQLNELLRSLPLAVAQVGAIAQRMAGFGELRADSLTGTGDPAELATDASIYLGTASLDLARAGEQVAKAYSRTTHLYWDGPDVAG